MVERFKLLLFLGLITLLNFGQHAKEERGTAVFFGRQGERRIRRGREEGMECGDARTHAGSFCSLIS
jgi:hypothetical protein